MSNLEIHDGFAPYYAGREPFEKVEKTQTKTLRRRAVKTTAAKGKAQINPREDRDEGRSA